MGKPIIAIMYDFDKTLCTKDMQEYGFIPKIGMNCQDFWQEVTALTDRQEMDSILAYMYLMVDKARKKEIKVQKKDFNELGTDIEYFPGVTSWFDRINDYGDNLGVSIEHYIVSSGIKEIIEGSSIAKNFKRIYACEFMYDYTENICWPKMAVNYTAKTQFLFRINKGILDINSSSNKELNEYTPDNLRRIPFTNMIYIGDGLTDVPCMKLVKANGGNSVAVYQQDKKDLACELLKDNRVDFICDANYDQDSKMEKVIKTIIDQLSVKDKLNSYK
ncbi:MAG: HAD family hydrolase [Erysipelotrichaceae bacterium]